MEMIRINLHLILEVHPSGDIHKRRGAESLAMQKIMRQFLAAMLSCTEQTILVVYPDQDTARRESLQRILLIPRSRSNP